MHTTSRTAEHPTRSDTVTILTNVIWIVEQLDRTGLRELDDVPVLELAKHISVGRRAAA
jgi:hypothetical protein